jgi:hypothetical protein
LKQILVFDKQPFTRKGLALQNVRIH